MQKDGKKEQDMYIRLYYSLPQKTKRLAFNSIKSHYLEYFTTFLNQKRQ